MKNTLKRSGGVFTRLSALFGLLVVAMFASMGAASATTPDPVSGAFDDASSKVTTYGGAMILLILVGLGIGLGVKYLVKGFRRA